MALPWHVDRYVGLERAVVRTREVFAAQTIHFAVLPFLRFLRPGVRCGATLGHTGASDMDWSILLYLDLSVQSFRRLNLLVDGGRYLQLRPRQAAVWIHRGRRNPRCDCRGERAGFAGSAGAAGLSACRLRHSA